MNDDINTLLFAMVPESRFTEIMREGSKQSRHLSEASPPPGAQGVWNNHAGSEL